MVHRMECMFCLTDAGVYPHNVNVPWTTPAALCVTRQADFQVFVLCGVCTLRIPHFCPGRRVPAYPQPCNATRGRIVVFLGQSCTIRWVRGTQDRYRLGYAGRLKPDDFCLHAAHRYGIV